MAVLQLPEKSYLLQRLSYCPNTGVLTWLPWGENKTFIARYAGKEAFTTLERGYRQGRIDGTLYYAHRIIWRMVTGESPQDIDHINGNRADNRWANLRNVSRQINMQNRRLLARNKTGHHGVNQTAWGWQSYAFRDGQKICLGSFKTKPEAIAARKAAERILGYHQNHGRT